MNGTLKVEPTEKPASGPSRREFLANMIMTVGAALGLGSVAFRFAEYLYPVVPPVKWIEVFASKVSDIPENGVRFVNLPEGPVMLEKVGSKVRALSAICTHLGCIVHWHPKVREFICPCHHGH
ncbi:MAG TPA: Rieske 2Fe-2S domain-containing protein, partial [Verrucomicrobiae bacterium]|nr:Rieske 2Fe-2S domain-containing protein [Verrucomicrobiae bacterium]